MRLTFKLGLFFTFTPVRPGSVTGALLEGRVGKKALRHPVALLFLLLAILLSGGAGIWGSAKFIAWRDAKCAPAAVVLKSDCNEKTCKKTAAATPEVQIAAAKNTKVEK